MDTFRKEIIESPCLPFSHASQCKGSSTWTVHGLWPQSDKNCKGDALDVKALGDTLVGKLKTGWPSCPGGKSNEDFWKHEWQKHGRCSGLTQSGYFEKSLALASGFDYKKDCIMTKSECRSCWDADFKLTKC